MREKWQRANSCSQECHLHTKLFMDPAVERLMGGITLNISTTFKVHHHCWCAQNNSPTTTHNQCRRRWKDKRRNFSMPMMVERANCAGELPQLKPTMVMNFTSCWENGDDLSTSTYQYFKRRCHTEETRASAHGRWRGKEQACCQLCCFLCRNRKITATDLQTDLQQVTCVHLSALMILQLTDALVRVWEISKDTICHLEVAKML